MNDRMKLWFISVRVWMKLRFATVRNFLNSNLFHWIIIGLEALTILVIAVLFVRY